MKMTKILVLSAILLTSCFASYAITNTAIAISGTNIVLSWPSYGYESYLIQYRQTLDATDSWSCLTNAYPANSTNLTTFTLYGVVSPPGLGGGGGGGGGGALLHHRFPTLREGQGPLVALGHWLNQPTALAAQSHCPFIPPALTCQVIRFSILRPAKR